MFGALDTGPVKWPVPAHAEPAQAASGLFWLAIHFSKPASFDAR
jgi:hypothetical protein